MPLKASFRETAHRRHIGQNHFHHMLLPVDLMKVPAKVLRIRWVFISCLWTSPKHTLLFMLSRQIFPDIWATPDFSNYLFSVMSSNLSGNKLGLVRLSILWFSWCYSIDLWLGHLSCPTEFVSLRDRIWIHIIFQGRLTNLSQETTACGSSASHCIGGGSSLVDELCIMAEGYWFVKSCSLPLSREFWSLLNGTWENRGDSYSWYPFCIGQGSCISHKCTRPCTITAPSSYWGILIEAMDINPVCETKD